MKRPKAPEGREHPRLLVVLKNMPPDVVALRQSGYVPNAGYVHTEGGAPTIQGVLDGIAPGEYSATIYYLPHPRNEPVGQADLRFSIEADKTTEIVLKEGDFQPIKDVTAR